jgi:hypothetical protein
MASVEPLSDPPRGSAASIIASSLIAPGFGTDAVVAAFGRVGAETHHIRKIAIPSITAIANAA